MDIEGDLKESGASGKYPAKTKKALAKGTEKSKKITRNGKELGKLHALLTNGLPEYVNDGVLDVRRLAEDIGDGISYQAIYSWFTRERISARRIMQICQMSRATEPRFQPKPYFVNGELTPEWRPLCRDDFWEFMG
jgi:hypothetical protein